MPEFVMDTRGTIGTPGLGYGSSLQWDDLKEFTQGFIEALLFCETSHCFSKADWPSDDSDDWEGRDGNIPRDSCFGDIYPQSMARIAKLCHDYRNQCAALLESAKELEPGTDNFKYAQESLDDRRLGQLFYYASNGHGVGFTDDGDADCLAQLQQIARGYYELSASYGESVHGGLYVFFE